MGVIYSYVYVHSHDLASAPPMPCAVPRVLCAVCRVRVAHVLVSSPPHAVCCAAGPMCDVSCMCCVPCAETFFLRATDHRSGPPTTEAQSLSQWMADLLRRQDVLDATQLCLAEGKLAWVLYIDA